MQASDAAPRQVHMADYAPFPYAVEDVQLTFRLHPTATRVTARIRFRPVEGGRDLELHGRDLRLLSAAIDGQPVDPRQTEEGLVVAAADLPDGPFTWQAEVEIDPAANTALEGLYMSNGMFCTQCEAEGFRKITFYPDRPDVMAPFTVRIEADQPVLLSNGNPVAAGDGWAEWQDPWPKPSYLFALVAGDLVAHSDTFTTASGRNVKLAIWVRPSDEGKCAYAMDALKRSMRWDEETYGREYDLDVFNIVAVDDFNAGAMENKGLNIFNARLVLASPETATDADYERIESVIAHEYFHNWTGNRVTCRDWFQLSLKEGLTVFRDQQFSGDMRGHAVKRIQDVIDLRARQFREDAGPLAHPVRPESFVEINNFYTSTVYEKGAEVIAMLRTLVGPAAYRKALDLYFDRHDGQATTIEAWLKVFEDATGRDLGQFKRWYSQAGTPHLRVEDDFSDGRYTLTFTQETPPTPGQPDKLPLVIPIAVGLLNPNGDEVVPTTVLEMTEARQSFTFDGLATRPVPSILRGFSAPVILNRVGGADDRALLLAHDNDAFNRWEAGRSLAKDVLSAMIADGAAPDAGFLDAMARLAGDQTLDPAFRALALALPSEDDMAQTLFDAGHTPDPARIHDRRQALRDALAHRLAGDLGPLMAAMTDSGPFSADAAAAGRRSMLAAALGYQSRLDGGAAALEVFERADNMTLAMAALGCLVPTAHGPAALAAFYDRWRGDRLVMDKWFMIQVAMAEPDDALAIARRLTGHPDFNPRNPNRLRAVLYGLAGGNPAAFHAADGSGYDWFADWIIRTDAVNPQVAARAATQFESWARYDADRQDMMRHALGRIRATRPLSRNTAEMVARLLDG